MNLQELFISNLKRIRKQKKITQEKLAEMCQTDTSYIGQIEIGRRFPSWQLIEKLAAALDTPAYLLFKPPYTVDKNAGLMYVADAVSDQLKDKVYKMILRESEKLTDEQSTEHLSQDK